MHALELGVGDRVVDNHYRPLDYLREITRHARRIAARVVPPERAVSPARDSE